MAASHETVSPSSLASPTRLFLAADQVDKLAEAA
jgi:hypothetical protein